VGVLVERPNEKSSNESVAGRRVVDSFWVSMNKLAGWWLGVVLGCGAHEEREATVETAATTTAADSVGASVSDGSGAAASTGSSESVTGSAAVGAGAVEALGTFATRAAGRFSIALPEAAVIRELRAAAPPWIAGTRADWELTLPSGERVLVAIYDTLELARPSLRAAAVDASCAVFCGDCASDRERLDVLTDARLGEVVVAWNRDQEGAVIGAAIWGVEHDGRLVRVELATSARAAWLEPFVHRIARTLAVTDAAPVVGRRTLEGFALDVPEGHGIGAFEGCDTGGFVIAPLHAPSEHRPRVLLQTVDQAYGDDFSEPLLGRRAGTIAGRRVTWREFVEPDGAYLVAWVGDEPTWEVRIESEGAAREASLRMLR
jgi:hypothetical protein